MHANFAFTRARNNTVSELTFIAITFEKKRGEKNEKREIYFPRGHKNCFPVNNTSLVYIIAVLVLQENKRGNNDDL